MQIKSLTHDKCCNKLLHFRTLLQLPPSPVNTPAALSPAVPNAKTAAAKATAVLHWSVLNCAVVVCCIYYYYCGCQTGNDNDDDYDYDDYDNWRWCWWRWWWFVLKTDDTIIRLKTNGNYNWQIESLTYDECCCSCCTPGQWCSSRCSGPQAEASCVSKKFQEQ